MHINMQAQTRTHTHTYTQTHTHTYIYILTHTHAHTHTQHTTASFPPHHTRVSRTHTQPIYIYINVQACAHTRPLHNRLLPPQPQPCLAPTQAPLSPSLTAYV